MLPFGASDNRSQAPEVSSIASLNDFQFVAPHRPSDALSRAPSTQTLDREPLGLNRPGTPIGERRALPTPGKKEIF